MTRKDSEKDADRPHYYSQFWLDIAAGRRVIGGPKPEDAEANEAEAPEPVTVLTSARKTERSETLREAYASAVLEPEVEEDDDELDQEEVVEEGDIPDIDVDLAASAHDDFSEEEPESEGEDFFEEEGGEEEEEEEDDEEWGRRGARKKPKPVRPAKPVKKPKREIRRNF